MTAFGNGEPVWTDAEVLTLTDLWDQGLSASIIGKQLNRSRSGVCGKVARLRIAGHVFRRDSEDIALTRAKPPPRDTSGRTRRIPPRRPPRPFLERPPVTDVPHAKPWIDRRAHECAFPVGGQGADTLSCCAPSGEHTYCAAHQAVMFSPTPPTRDLIRSVRRAA